MFESLDHAHATAVDILPAHAIVPAMAQLIPAIGIRPVSTDRIGGTRIDGTPDVSPEFEWPVADLSVHPDLSRFDVSAEELPSGPSPLWFLAQVDLAEAHALGEVAELLPDHGRLLFFFDHIAGSYLEGPEAVRVIWDRSPVDKLQTAQAPAALVSRGAHLIYPPKPSELFASVTTPQRGSLCPETEPLFELIDEGNHPLSPWADEFDEFCEADDCFVEPEWRHHQMLGIPVPCQSDPRGYIAPDSADEWVNLLCYANVEVREGEVYFLIRKSDLAARDFTKVAGVYMQT
ncbi:DUF1963 domain-containing protein [Corynebacterium sp. H130]|uniref:DUF1963 domain-containing protein n=1 Tax=Corynebacterium sp. H130 TaxID=3133444 RepID=UPI0030AB7943